MSDRRSPFEGAPNSGGGDYSTEIPSADTHDARIVALIDLGTHRESFAGEPEKDARKCLLVYELDEQIAGMKNVNHVVCVRYTLSFHEKASLRKLAEAVLNDGQKFSGHIRYEELLGQPCQVQISHVPGKGEKADRTYSRVGTISAVPKKHRDRVFKAQRQECVWYIGDDIDDLPDYLPRVYGEEVKDIIYRCAEAAAMRQGQSKGQPAGAGAGEEPF